MLFGRLLIGNCYGFEPAYRVHELAEPAFVLLRCEEEIKQPAQWDYINVIG